MGVFSSIGSAISSTCSSVSGSLNSNDVEKDSTYQKYHNDIKKFDIESTHQHSVNANKGQSSPIIFAEKHDELDDIETLEDVKKYFEQRENKE